MMCSNSLKVSTTSYHRCQRVAPISTSSDRTKMCVTAQSRMNPFPRCALESRNNHFKISALSASMTTTKVNSQSIGGIGILEFLKGKNYFVTGATGLLAKAFVEKILRMSPNVGKIYLLVKAEDEQTALSRLLREIIESEAFRYQRQKYGGGYEKFMLGKLIPVAEMMRRITEEVDVIVHSAANTAFDDRYDDILRINVTGTSRTLELAKSSKKLRIFLHVSTAFVHGTREGTFPEEILESRLGDEPEKLLDVDQEIKLAIDLAKSLPKSEASQRMKDIGMARARSFGFKNTYELSKAMGEMKIHRSGGEFPIVILRPSVVESSYQEPFPGWIQGNKVMDPVIILYGKGRFPCMLADPDSTLDVVPLDIAVNAVVAAMAKHGKSTGSGFFTYHITSSASNPLTLFNIFKYFHSHFTFSPLVDAKGTEIRVEEVTFVNSIDEFRSLVEKAVFTKDDTDTGNGSFDQRKKEMIVEKITHLGRLYEPHFLYKARFDHSNSDKLIGEMSEKERLDFPMDMGRITS